MDLGVFFYREKFENKNKTQLLTKGIGMFALEIITFNISFLPSFHRFPLCFIFILTLLTNKTSFTDLTIVQYFAVVLPLIYSYHNGIQKVQLIATGLDFHKSAS